MQPKSVHSREGASRVADTVAVSELLTLTSLGRVEVVDGVAVSESLTREIELEKSITEVYNG